MKHLMRFNESFDNKIRTTIEEILLEFQDRGFITKVMQNGSRGQLTIIIENDNHNMNCFIDKLINIDDETSIFEMLFDYLEYTYELYLIRWIEGNGARVPHEYELNEQDEIYPTFHEVLKNRELSKIILFFNPSIITRLGK
jgi:hypothetical protein